MEPDSSIWVKRLTNPDPAVRRRALTQLELLGDPAFLGPLSRVFVSDPDPELRILAQKIAKEIYYGVIRRTAELQSASLVEREQAARILSKAQAGKQKRRR